MVKLFWNIKNGAFSHWPVLLFAHENLSHYWNHIKIWASSKHNFDTLVFTNRNMGHFSFVCFSMKVKFCMISQLFVFFQNTQLKKYCMNFLWWKMIETWLTRSSHKILHSFQILSSNSKILQKFELNVNCLNNFLEWFSKSFRTH